MISGFFIYSKNGKIFDDWIDVLKKFFKNIFLPFIILSIIAIIFNDFFISKANIVECIKNIDFNSYSKMLFDSFTHFSVAFLKPMAAHLWYVYAHLTILLVYPITRYILTKSKKISYGIIIIYFIMLMTNDILVMKNIDNLNFVLNILYRPVFYSAFGYLLYNDIIKKFVFDKNSEQIIINKNLFFISLVIYIITFVLLYKVTTKYYLTINGNYVYPSWYSSLIATMASTFILMVFNINFDYFLSDKIKNAICFVASKTLGIYLIHYFVAMKLNSIRFRDYIITNRPTFIHQVANYIISILLVFVISFIMVIIIDLLIAAFKNIVCHKKITTT